ncbi:hypothetical protein [Gimesia sp.]|uniref:hypothetical protein n=1 Tax=Gimesia sp. TaxID=2024833 RepID=UPI000C6AA1A0|nr:hypothetical protein [Gimesia sp.]MAX39836.1 hypothetical protein [Gimesia sp.]HAH49304.1 hypothetical protein [Planctomycetaceae bacterium]|tara:strand:- start:4169 stop:5113 length:945 start_codon:yes stop_codon:yes gene_type:complete
MPGVTVTCPHCQNKLKLKSPDLLGKKVKCKSCENPFVLKADGKKKSKPAPDEFEDDFGDFDDSAMDRVRRARKRKGTSGNQKSATAASSKPDKAKKKSEASIPLPLLIGGCVLGVLLTGGLGYFMFSMGSSLNAGQAAASKVEVPQKFAKFSPEVGDIGAEYPEGWKVENGGGQGGVQSWAKFISPDEGTSISIRGNMTGSALGSAGLAMNQGADAEEIEPPVVDIHRLMKRKFEDDYSNYEELGDYTLLKTKMGDACQSIFTTKSLLGGKQKGYRVTLLTGRVQFNLVCLCDDAVFDKMRPAFDHVVNTVHEK